MEQEWEALSKRLDLLEEILREALRRLHRLETHLGLEPLPPAKEAAPVPPKRAPSVAAPPSRATDWEIRAGGQWALWAGVVLVLFAASFGLAYGWRYLGPSGRVLLGMGAGSLFLAGGAWARGRTARWFHEGVTAGGLALLYLSLWAAFTRHHLLDFPSAFVGMGLVVVMGVDLAVAYDAPSLILLATLGGFLTPVLLRSEGVEGGQVLAFWAYVTLLNGGILATSAYKRWRGMNWVVFGAAVVLLAGWFLERYQPQMWKPVFAFLGLNFLLFTGMGMVYPLRYRTPTEVQDWLYLAGVAIAYSVAAGAVYPSMRGGEALALGGLYGGLAMLCALRSPGDRGLYLTTLGLSVAFFTLAFPLLLRGGMFPIAWGAEGAALFFVGSRLGKEEVSTWGLGVWGLAVLAAVGAASAEDPTGLPPLWEKHFVRLLFLTAATAWMAFLPLASAGGWSARSKPFLAAAALLLPLLALSREVFHLLRWLQFPSPEAWRYAAHLGISLVWSLYGATLLGVGIASRQSLARQLALGLLGLATLKVFLWDLSFLTLPFRMVSFGVLGLLLIGVAWLYSRYGERLREWAKG